ncbi:MAG: hypothetical protein RL189_1692 [Pseudomonadota bacterium]|jgi:hypothetical protein
MKSKNIKLIILSMYLMFAGCSHSSSRAGAPFKAEILYFTPSSGSDSGQWTVGERVLKTLENPDTLVGNNFEILSGRALTIDSTVGSLITGRVSGSEKKNPIRYTVKNGTIIPRDSTTLLMFSGFYAFEQVFEQVEAATGDKVTDLKDNVGGRYQVLFEPTLDVEDSGVEARVSLKLNAAFNPQSDNFILFRRSALEQIPLAANFKVISHEFGHALFKRSFFNQKQETCAKTDEAGVEQRKKDKFFDGRLSVEYALSGFNEGYSDFVSYVMTGEPNALSGSFGNAEDRIVKSRSLSGDKFTFAQLNGNQICPAGFYCIGTLFARALYKASQIHAKQSEGLRTFSRQVYAALKSTLSFLGQSPSLDVLPLPSKEAASCQMRRDISLSYDGAVSSAFLSAFLRGLPSSEEKTILCIELSELFGTTGFVEEVRGVCNP